MKSTCVAVLCPILGGMSTQYPQEHVLISVAIQTKLTARDIAMNAFRIVRVVKVKAFEMSHT